jgi:hypothetical protein
MSLGKILFGGHACILFHRLIFKIPRVSCIGHEL